MGSHKGGEKLSPKTGRPVVGNEPKNKRISLRATETTVKKFQECSDITRKTQSDREASFKNHFFERGYFYAKK